MATCPECHARFADEVESCPEDGAALVPDGLLAAEEEPISEGTMVGEYRIQRKLGAGTFGDVYAGEQPVIGKRVAVKVLNRRFASDPVMVSRFVAEARAVNRIRQRNIIDIFSFGVLPGTGRHYFVMELLDGMTLGALLHRTGRVPVALALPIVRGIADGLDAVHESGITHRDLKPDNVFLARERDGSYFPKLLDFGIAKLLGEDVAHKTGSGMVLGTPRYMSPEQARGKRADHRADVYALGVMIHEMLTGSPLFEGDSAVDVLLKQAVDDPRPMSEVWPELPAELDAPVQAMLRKRPEERPDTAGRAVAALAACARRLGLDRAETTLAELYEGGTPTTREVPRVAGTTVTIERHRGPRAPAPLAAPPPPVAAPESADPLSKTEHAPASGAPATLLSPTTGDTRSDPEEAAGRSSPTTESVSVVATDSAIRRLTRSRRLRTLAGAAIVVAAGFTLWALGRASAGQSPPVVAVTASSSTTAVSPVAETAIEPTVKPVPLAEDIAVRLTTRPADVEVWKGDRRLGSSSAAIVLPRGPDAVELRLRKAGFADEVLSITPDRDQTREVNLTPLPATKSAGGAAAPGARPASSAGKLDRILGGRD